ncbi:hypothetical protein HD554DRAFT_2036624 [Boletus coccyginus]|nr:hypothetical protein HD554DRAFT_2036624 [Boletus coccyginus]
MDVSKRSSFFQDRRAMHTLDTNVDEHDLLVKTVFVHAAPSTTRAMRLQPWNDPNRQRLTIYALLQQLLLLMNELHELRAVGMIGRKHIQLSRSQTIPLKQLWPSSGGPSSVGIGASMVGRYTKRKASRARSRSSAMVLVGESGGACVPTAEVVGGSSATWLQDDELALAATDARCGNKEKEKSRGSGASVERVGAEEVSGEEAVSKSTAGTGGASTSIVLPFDLLCIEYDRVTFSPRVRMVQEGVPLAQPERSLELMGGQEELALAIHLHMVILGEPVSGFPYRTAHPFFNHQVSGPGPGGHLSISVLPLNPLDSSNEACGVWVFNDEAWKIFSSNNHYDRLDKLYHEAQAVGLPVPDGARLILGSVTETNGGIRKGLALVSAYIDPSPPCRSFKGVGRFKVAIDSITNVDVLQRIDNALSTAQEIGLTDPQGFIDPNTSTPTGGGALKEMCVGFGVSTQVCRYKRLRVYGPRWPGDFYHATPQPGMTHWPSAMQQICKTDF